jgi:hypothetical protein
MGRYLHQNSGGGWPYVRFPEVPPAPPGSKGGVIRPKSPFSIPFVATGPRCEGFDRLSESTKNAPRCLPR